MTSQHPAPERKAIQNTSAEPLTWMTRQRVTAALALQFMPTVEKLGAAMAAKVRHLGAVTVVSPAMGGLVLGQEVARQLGVRFIFVEKEDGRLALRRGFKIASNEKI